MTLETAVEIVRKIKRLDFDNLPTKEDLGAALTVLMETGEKVLKARDEIINNHAVLIAAMNLSRVVSNPIDHEANK